MIPDLDKILAHLRRLGRGAADRLQPGLSPSSFSAWEARFPFVFTREMETIYSWRNGTRAEEGALLEDLYFFPGFYFLSIEEALQIFEERRASPQWRDGWYPLFADGGGDFYVIPCTSSKVESAEVIGFIHGEPEQIAEYETLTSMVKTLEACFAEGAFFVDADDTMEIDDDKQREIAARYNPGIPEWQG